MQDQLWALFRETGDPMGYLLYKAEKKTKEPARPKSGKQPKPPQGPPPASM